MSDPDYSPEMAGRLGKLETAISKCRTVRFEYWSISRDDQRERALNPLALLNESGAWYVVGEDLEDDDAKKFRVSRIRSDIRYATRRERDFRPRRTSPSRTTAADLPGRSATCVERPRSRCVATPPGGSRGRCRTPGRSRTASSRPTTRRARCSHRGCCARTGAPSPSSPNGCAATSPPGSRRSASATRADVRGSPRRSPPRSTTPRPSAPPARSRPSFGVLQALLAHLLASCGDGREATLDAHELADRFSIPFDQLDEHLSLLNLVNFGGGCYTVYAELRGDRVHVDKELFGDVFRRPPRLTPLEARAIRLALEFVGPMIAAGSRSALDNVRHKLEETFGQFELVQTAEPQIEEHEEELVRILSEAIEAHRVVTIEYLKEGEVARRHVEPYAFQRELPFWRVHTWDRGRRQAADVQARPHALGPTVETDVPTPGGLRPELPAQPADRARLVLAEDRPVEARARRPPARTAQP